MTIELDQEQEQTTSDWQNSFIGKALSAHTREYFHGHPILKDIPEDAKQELIVDFYKKIYELTHSDEPILTLRAYIAVYVQSYAIFQVLHLTPEKKAASFYQNNPHISGELHTHIKSLAIHNQEINDLNLKNELLSDEDLLMFCETKAAISLFYMNGINIVRYELKDIIKDNDWLRPFIESMLVWEEDKCRKNIGLSPLLKNYGEAHKHSTFIQYVKNGSKNPHETWLKGDEKADDIPLKSNNH